MDNNKFNGSDTILTTQIVEGCTALIGNIIAQNPSKYGAAARHQEPKSLATTSVSLTIPQNTEFRPSDLREKLPAEIENVHRSVMSRIISHNVRIKKIEKIQNFNPRGKRGHPQEYGEENPSGPKVYYKSSTFENRVNTLLSNRRFVKSIYQSLRKEKLLFKLENWVQLFIYNVIKNDDKETAWNICKSVFSIPYKQSKFEQEYFIIKGLDEKQLVNRAKQKANEIVKSKSMDDYLYVFKTGAYYSVNKTRN